jgi:hypothetical protein
MHLPVIVTVTVTVTFLWKKRKLMSIFITSLLTRNYTDGLLRTSFLKAE